jgi:hypothetical protein
MYPFLFSEATSNFVRLWWMLTLTAVLLIPISYKTLVLPTAAVFCRNITHAVGDESLYYNDRGCKTNGVISCDLLSQMNNAP